VPPWARDPFFGDDFFGDSDEEDMMFGDF
jgi:hypothetical protein